MCIETFSLEHQDLRPLRNSREHKRDQVCMLGDVQATSSVPYAGMDRPQWSIPFCPLERVTLRQWQSAPIKTPYHCLLDMLLLKLREGSYIRKPLAMLMPPNALQHPQKLPDWSVSFCLHVAADMRYINERHSRIRVTICASLSCQGLPNKSRPANHEKEKDCGPQQACYRSAIHLLPPAAITHTCSRRVPSPMCVDGQMH